MIGPSVEPRPYTNRPIVPMVTACGAPTNAQFTPSVLTLGCTVKTPPPPCRTRSTKVRSPLFVMVAELVVPTATVAFEMMVLSIYPILFLAPFDADIKKPTGYSSDGSKVDCKHFSDATQHNRLTPTLSEILNVWQGYGEIGGCLRSQLQHHSVIAICTDQSARC